MDIVEKEFRFDARQKIDNVLGLIEKQAGSNL